MTETMKRIVLAKRPDGFPTDENFRLEESQVPEPGEGEVLVRVKYMSLDPYMRGRMDDGPSYAAPVPVDGTMEAGAVGEVIASNDPKFAVGDHAFGMFGWATHGVQPAKMMRKVDPDQAPIQTSLGVLGMPGFTAWAGMTAYSNMKAGETLVVGAATGPVGSMVGQLAKQAGLRVVGVAGGADKCAMAVDKFGFDACVDHRGKDAKAMREALAAECPDGIDIYFENVGGDVLEAVIPLLNEGARVPICGFIAHYNLTEEERRPTPLQRLRQEGLPVLGKDGSESGFAFFAFSQLSAKHPDAENALLEMSDWIKAGRLKYRESVTEGIESCVPSFIGMLGGANFGKTMVKVS